MNNRRLSASSVQHTYLKQPWLQAKLCRSDMLRANRVLSNLVEDVAAHGGAKGIGLFLISRCAPDVPDPFSAVLQEAGANRRAPLLERSKPVSGPLEVCAAAGGAEQV